MSQMRLPLTELDNFRLFLFQKYAKDELSIEQTWLFLETIAEFDPAKYGGDE